MTPERWKEVDKLYQAALELRPADRLQFLIKACPDVELRSEVESLLRHRNPELFDRPALDVAANLATAQQTMTVAGAMIGHYEVLSLIGKGGMGEVYRARDITLNRTVALKLLKPAAAGDDSSKSRFLREARLAATLEHPNICTIFDAGESLGHFFIAMQYVEGRPLRQIIDRRPLDLATLLRLVIQIANALAAAHRREIVHRDVKPENIIVTPEGDAKVLDFGLAKFMEDAEPNLTASNCVVRTPAYMSPEQARGKHVDKRSDVFSFGVVLYEMATGRVPFQKESSVETMHAIIEQPHTPARELNKDLPAELERIIDSALKKSPDERYADFDAIVADLQRILADRSTAPAVSAGTHISRRHALAGLWILIIALLTAGAWSAWRALLERRARSAVPNIEQLAIQGKFLDAYSLAVDVRRLLPSDPKLTRLMRAISDSLTVETDPPGAKVFLRHYVDPPDQPRSQLVGQTPLSEAEIARGEYVLRVEKEGYSPFEGSIYGFAVGDPNSAAITPPIRIQLSLKPAGQVPRNMTSVPGGTYRLVGWNRPTDEDAGLDGFFIDKFEVTNQDYKEFVSSGGYLKREFWKYPFVKNGKQISWEDAMREFVDRTRLPGPRAWSNQDFPRDKARHPVTGISWYEAAAYAAFRGKTLPSIFQWEKTARNGTSTPSDVTMPWGFSRKAANHANLASTGTIEAGSLEFGMSAFGAYDMAGNVSEWLANETSEGFLAAGGSWGDADYSALTFTSVPSFFTSDRIGFRCVVNAPNVTTDQGAFRIELQHEIPTYTPAPKDQVQKWIDGYRYEDSPLGAKTVETVEANDWTREKITFAGRRGDRVIAYLYLPKHFPKPVQVVHIYPDGGVVGRFKTIPESFEQQWIGLVRAGRALFGVVHQGWLERDNSPNFVRPPIESAEYAERIKTQIFEVRRGLDYLSTRPELAMNQLAFFYGSAAGPPWILPSVEPRYKVVVAYGAGAPKFLLQLKPEVNPINFLPKIQAPMLFIHGRYDENSPVKNTLEPLLHLLRAPHRVEYFEGGHMPDFDFVIPQVNTWLDENLGPVRKN